MGCYVSVGEHRVWHEVGGDGPPLVLLHGAFGTAESFGPIVPALRGNGFRTFAPERRGHGHTADQPGPITYALMAEDTIAYLDSVVAPEHGPAHLVGWSDGAVVALLVARDRPDLVARQVLIGQYFDSSGKVPGSQMVPSLSTPQMRQWLQAGYAVSPDGPAHFDVVFDKIIRMLTTEPELDLHRLADVATPTLVLQGDRDEVRLEHSVAVTDSLPQARLAVLPGTHLLPLELPHVGASLLTAFLTESTEPGH